MSKNIEQAFILAAGRGERMRPLTDSVPKPLVQVKGQTILDLIISKLNQLKYIKKIIVNAYHLAPQIEEHIKRLNNPKIIVSTETRKLETGGGILNALPLLDKNKPLLIINGDLVWRDSPQDSDLELMAENFDISKMDILLGLIPKADYWGYEGEGDFDFDNKSKNIYRSKEARNLNYAFSGIQIINPKIFDSPPEEEAFSMNYFYQKARGTDGLLDRIKGQELKGQYYHIGTAQAVRDFTLLA